MTAKPILHRLSFCVFSLLWSGMVITVFFVNPIAEALQDPAFNMAGRIFELALLGVAAFIAMHLPWLIVMLSRCKLCWTSVYNAQFRTGPAGIVGYLCSILILAASGSVAPGGDTLLLTASASLLTLMVSGFAIIICTSTNET